MKDMKPSHSLVRTTAPKQIPQRGQTTLTSSKVEYEKLLAESTHVWRNVEK